MSQAALAAPRPGPGASAPDDLIDVHGLWKRYGEGSDAVSALEDISFRVRRGEFVSVVGPSGCGKSTLLKILAGLLPMSEGSAVLDGTPLDGTRRDIGVVFQSPVLFPWRSVVGNVMLPADVQRLERGGAEARARDLLAMVGLQGFETRYPRQLSGGMQQRVALARALIHDPSLLLMDEPFGALDAMTREAMNVELQRIWLERQKTVLFITHSTGEAVFLSDRVLVMSARPGRICDEVLIDIPRPRGLEVMNTPEFGRHVSRIRAALNAGGGLE